jgi:Pyruvate/2-oxoacid:ferredoxin oxidoreductase gamma subunit
MGMGLEIGADVDRVDLLATFDAETIVRHIFEVSSGGGVIVDKNMLGTELMPFQLCLRLL